MLCRKELTGALDQARRTRRGLREVSSRRSHKLIARTSGPAEHPQLTRPGMALQPASSVKGLFKQSAPVRALNLQHGRKRNASAEGPLAPLCAEMRRNQHHDILMTRLPICSHPVHKLIVI